MDFGSPMPYEEAMKYETQFGIVNHSTFSNSISMSGELERKKILNKLKLENVIKKVPVNLQCQFCMQNVTTITEQNTVREDINDEEWKTLKKQMCCAFWFPLSWIFLPCVLLIGNNHLNSTVTKHKCPNCNNYIGLSVKGQAQYCQIPGTKEEQFNDLKVRAMEARARRRSY